MHHIFLFLIFFPYMSILSICLSLSIYAYIYPLICHISLNLSTHLLMFCRFSMSQFSLNEECFHFSCLGVGADWHPNPQVTDNNFSLI